MSEAALDSDVQPGRQHNQFDSRNIQDSCFISSFDATGEFLAPLSIQDMGAGHIKGEQFNALTVVKAGPSAGMEET